MKAKKLWQAVWDGNCPRCRQGKLFSHRIFQLNKLSNTHESCEVCGLRYEQEPGFFYGAMYVSYAFSVGLMLTTSFIVYHLFENPPVSCYIVAVTALAILFYPFNFRYSRIVFLYLFGGVSYDPKFKKQ